MTVALSHHGSRLRTVCESLSMYPSCEYQMYAYVCVQGDSRMAETYVYIAAKSQATCILLVMPRPTGTLDTRRGATQKLPDKWLNRRVLVTAQPTSHHVQHEEQQSGNVSSGIGGSDKRPGASPYGRPSWLQSSEHKSISLSVATSMQAGQPRPRVT